MDFTLTDEQNMLVDTSLALGSEFGPEYWRKKDTAKEYPEEFFDAMGKHGFFSLGLPEDLGGTPAGITEVTLAMEALCRGGAGGGPALGYLFGKLGANIIKSNGNDEQKKKCLPEMAEGKKMCAFALSEPDAGTNTLNIKTFAERVGDEYVISGAKWYITNIERSDIIIVAARTTEVEYTERRSEGISLFLVDLPNENISFTPIPKHGFRYYQSSSVFLDQIKVPATSLIGTEGAGFSQMLETLNPERILVAAGAVGIGRLAVQTAVDYANDRAVFGQPIGAHQAIQHPLAAAYAKLESAWGMVLKAAWLHDQNAPSVQVGSIANMAKYLAVEASIEACHHAMQTHGGNGFAEEYHVERWYREVQLFRLAPVTQQMTLNFIGEHVLGMPRSY